MAPDQIEQARPVCGRCHQPLPIGVRYFWVRTGGQYCEPCLDAIGAEGGSVAGMWVTDEDLSAGESHES